MGGNALKNTKTRRYQADEFYALALTVLNLLRKRFPDCVMQVIQSYTNKESFGDMDILINSDGLPANWVDLVRSQFAPSEMVKNGNCLSFDVNEVQIDLIVCKPDEYETSVNYFAYNDLGNLLGRLANSMGLKLGHDGLSYSWRDDGTYVYRTEVIATDWVVILHVLGLDASAYYDGFETMEDIFEYVASSPYFHPDIYLFENRNNAGRTRDAKRPTYNAFLDWCDTNKERLTHYPKKESKSDWLPYLLHSIPGFRERYYEVNREWFKDTVYKRKFNGDLVSIWTGLKGKELGDFMRYLKEKRGPDDSQWREWVIGTDTTTSIIMVVIVKMFEKYNNEEVNNVLRSPN